MAQFDGTRHLARPPDREASASSFHEKIGVLSSGRFIAPFT